MVTNIKDRGSRKERTGDVVSKSGEKTVVVLVKRRSLHPLYGKVQNLQKKYHVHDEKNEADLGDSVKIVETRPYSKLKRWRVVEVLKKSTQI